MNAIFKNMSSMSTNILISGIIATLFVIWPLTCFASFLIELKTGAEMRTDQYWEENGKIHFYYSGGIVTFEKEAVKKIEEYDAPDEKETVPAEKSEPTPTNSESEIVLKTESAPDTIKSNKNEDKILEDFHLLKERLKDIDNLENQALYKLAEDLTGWRNKIAAEGSGPNYTNQLMEMDAMFDKIENTLKERGQ